MKAQSILIIYLIFFAGEFIFEGLLDMLNILHIRRHRENVPEAFREVIDEKTHLKSAEYSVVRLRFGIVSEAFSSAVLLAVILTGLFGTLESVLFSLALPDRILGIVYIFTVSLGFSLISLPFSAYSRFRIENRYGFNTMGAGLFFLDYGKGLILSAIISFPLLYLLFLLIDTVGALWWLPAFGAIALFQLLMTFLYPVVIAPLFNKFTPLEEGSLRDRLFALADRLEFKSRGIFVMDGSKRTRHSNAFFTGIGGAKRIVLYDTLMKELTEEEIEAVLAHEIGHERKKHTLKILTVSMFMLAAGLFAASYLLRWPPLFMAFGFAGPSPHALFIIVSLCAGPFTFFGKPLITAWSRKFEYQADAFAREALKSSGPLISGLISLHKNNLSSLTPHPLYSFYHYSHPTLRERISALNEDSRRDEA